MLLQKLENWIHKCDDEPWDAELSCQEETMNQLVKKINIKLSQKANTVTNLHNWFYTNYTRDIRGNDTNSF